MPSREAGTAPILDYTAAAPARPRLTLALCTLLHAFTHAYLAMLVPLYLLMTDALHLSGVWMATLVVSIYGSVYFLASYPAGILADHVNRKNLLGIGLIGNAIAIGLMGLTHNYGALVGLAVLAGLFGTLFHPSANALAAAHFPRSPGMALGMMGIGSGLGFWSGAQYAGCGAQTAGGAWGLAGWQVPCLELGLAGVIVGIVFLLVARESQHASAGPRVRVPMQAGMRRRTLAIAIVSGCRDFGGVAASSLLSIYLQKAHHYDARQAGTLLGSMVLLSMVATPTAVYFSGGRRRLPGLAMCMVAGGLVLATVPYFPATMAWLLGVLAIFQVFHLSSYALSEISLVERVDPDVRGRVVGIYLTLAGTSGAISPWVMGYWTDKLGPRAFTTPGYYVPFAVLGALMVFASLATRLLGKLGRPHEPTAEDVGRALTEAE